MTTKATKKKKTKSKKKSKVQPKLTSWCSHGDGQCQADRIIDWGRAYYEATSKIKAGTLYLCPEHLEKLQAERYVA